MNYSVAFEKNDYSKIDKLNSITDLENYWNLVRKFTKKVTSDHSISRWQILAELRYKELKSIYFNRYGMLAKYIKERDGENAGTVETLMAYARGEDVSGLRGVFDAMFKYGTGEEVVVSQEFITVYNALRSAGVLK